MTSVSRAFQQFWNGENAQVAIDAVADGNRISRLFLLADHSACKRIFLQLSFADLVADLFGAKIPGDAPAAFDQFTDHFLAIVALETAR